MRPNQLPIDSLFERVAAIITDARNKVVSAVNLTMVYANFEIGKYIVENEQKGEIRAEYGKTILKDLSKRLTEKFGNGYSIETLQKIRKFYLIYSRKTISSAVLTKLQNNGYEKLSSEELTPNSIRPISQESPRFTLSWFHYLILIRIENDDERRFYEIEATNNHWSGRHLERQYASSLYERLALSRDKDQVMQLAKEGQLLSKPEDILKNPITLEFLGLDEKSIYSETTLERAIISKLQLFLLEMGKGFLFEARQKRFSFENQHFFVDLGLYNRLLQYFVLIDLKTDSLKHQDLGQMQMYVNYYDRYIKKEFENPTIGILLCKEKKQALVELTLPKEANIYSAEYNLYLPEKTFYRINSESGLRNLKRKTISVNNC